ncbi:hypothetical protein ATO7_01470 [Oceanococcus atlanticus]|uniref:Nucleoprotein/polynucleotide-associated enzyme n=1 Tax=Oceanococcus atlanticus TaxID=1317117 RepID=A0A1Y1SFS3_9GAMM|nr:DUF2058 family protein [Oceanococcus atlanticus]ORE88503.1 hypothetical protein ATO7_01470 [Oceanococcus atlanticus]
MSNSLRDQLIKAGLVTKKQAHETRKRKPRGKQAHQAKRQEKTQRDAELSALDAHKRERDRELNAQREVQRKAREQADWVRQMLGSHAVAKGKPGDDDPAFHFTLAGAVQHLYVGASQRAQLAEGKLGLVQFDGKYHLLPVSIARQLHEKIPQRTWVPEDNKDEPSGQDDPYADFQVPDDLMW